MPQSQGRSSGKGPGTPTYLKLPSSFQIHLPLGSRWPPKYSFLTSLSHTPLAFSLRSRHAWLPHSPRVQNAVRAFPGSRFYQSSLLHPRGTGLTFLLDTGSPGCWGLPGGREFSVSKALGRPPHLLLPGSQFEGQSLASLLSQVPLLLIQALPRAIIKHLTLLPSHQTQHLGTLAQPPARRASSGPAAGLGDD